MAGLLALAEIPGLGKELGWSLAWEHTTVLAEEHRDASSYHIIPVSRENAEQIAASLALKYWTPEATQLPWVTHAYPQ